MYTTKQYLKIQEVIQYLYKTLKHAENRDKPELFHSLHTGFLLMDHGYPLTIVIAGFLHDVLEEGRHYGELENLFGSKVYKLVLVNTKNKKIKGWPAQYKELIERILAYGEDALIIKAADVLENFTGAFNANQKIGKKKMVFLAKQIFKHTNSTDGIFGELRRTYNYWMNRKRK